MDRFFCRDTSIFAFPVNFAALLVLSGNIWFLHRYCSRHRFVRWLCSVQSALSFTGLTVALLIIEGIWALELHRTWIMIVLQLSLLTVLGLAVLKRAGPMSPRNILFLLNHAGLWITIASALFGAPDREEYRMVGYLALEGMRGIR